MATAGLSFVDWSNAAVKYSCVLDHTTPLFSSESFQRLFSLSLSLTGSKYALFSKERRTSPTCLELGNVPDILKEEQGQKIARAGTTVCFRAGISASARGIDTQFQPSTHKWNEIKLQRLIGFDGIENK